MSSVIEIGVYGLNEELMGKLKECCSKVFFRRNITYSFTQIGMDAYEEKDYDLIFVKIENIIGKFTDQILKYHGKVKALVVAIAESIESLLYAFKIDSYRAFLDRSEPEEICEIINGAIDNIFSHEKICIRTREEQKMIPIDEILYIEAIGDASVLLTEKEQLYTSKPLKYWEDLLEGKSFYRCHKSYIISLNNIKGYEDGNVIFESKYGTHNVMVAVRKRAELKRLAQ